LLNLLLNKDSLWLKASENMDLITFAGFNTTFEIADLSVNLIAGY